MNIKLASVSVPRRLWFFTGVLICIFLMISDVEHLFVYLLVLYMSLGFPGGSVVKTACNAGDLSLIPGLGRTPERETATHSSILAWRIL